MSNIRRTKQALLGAACVLAVCAGTAAPGKAETIDALLDLLKAKGAISQNEYDTLKARARAEAKGNEDRVRAAENRARAAEEKAQESETKSRATEAKVPQSEAKTRATEAKVAEVGDQIREEKLRAADLAAPAMPIKAPIQYVTVLKDCVGMRVGAVDICTSGDISFFGIEQFPDKNAAPPAINGGLATATQQNSNSIRGGLLPSSFQVNLKTHQAGLDIGAYFGVYVGGNNVSPGVFNANNGGSPVSLGTAGVDFRQVFGTIGTPTFGTVKVGRDIGIFASDAILNDLTLFGAGTPAANFAPGNTTLGRIGIGYLYTDFIPQITYKSPNFNGFTFAGGLFTPYSEIPFSGDPESGTMTGHDVPGFQGQLKYVNAFNPDTKLTLSASGVTQRHVTDCTAGIPGFGTSSCVGGAAIVSENVMPVGTSVQTWAADGFGKLDVFGFSFVAYGYTGSGVGTTALFFDGVDENGNARKSYGGYLQASYTFFNTFTLGGSYGASFLNTTGGEDTAEELANCTAAAPTTCLVHRNDSWIGFARYKLTDWVKLQAEYVHNRAQNQIGQTIQDDSILAGTTFFW